MHKLYETIARQLTERIDQSLYLPGDRIPGVRKLSEQFGVSISTVVQAQRLLEDEGRIEARPRSGYYVRTQPWPVPSPPALSRPSTKPTPVTGQELVLRLVQAANEAGFVQLGAAVPHPSFLPTRAIQRSLSSTVRKYGNELSTYQFPPGNPELRRQIARRMAEAGCQTHPDDIIITSGCQEALTLCLQAIAKPGDVIVIESPAFYGLLQAIEVLGMKALEIPTDPHTGISLAALSLALEKWPVKACALVPNSSNPLGCTMPDENKQALVDLLAQFDIPLIEDDIYGDLGFEAKRPRAVSAFDKNEQVLYCSSFSKSLSPGLRIGWVIPGKYRDKIEYRKYVTSLATPTLPQYAIADFLRQGGYDRYLRQVRRDYQRQVSIMIRAVGKYFPQETRVSQPQGGFVIWIELPKKVDSLQLCQQALAQRISIAPGQIFSATQKYRNFIRLNCAQPWNEVLEKAMITLGRMVHELNKPT